MNNDRNSKNKVFLIPYTEEEMIEMLKKAFSEIKESYSPKEKGEPETEEWFTQKQAARFFKTSEQTIMNWRKKGLIPYYQNERTVMFKKSELLEAMKKNDKLIK